MNPLNSSNPVNSSNPMPQRPGRPVLTAAGPSVQPAIPAAPARRLHAPWPEPLEALAARRVQAIRLLPQERGGCDAVILEQRVHADRVPVLLLAEQRVHVVSGSLPALAVTDPALALAMTRCALAWVLADRHADRSRVRALETELREVGRDHCQKLADVRAYVIARYRANQISCGELDAVLAQLGLAAYRPRHRVRFTVHGHFDVAPSPSESIEDTAAKVRDHLIVDAGSINELVSGTVDWDVARLEVTDTGTASDADAWSGPRRPRI